ncbi:hypothetical protein OCL06_05310 [Alteromonas sp. ASW11-19]|uniref:Uncharacterized protein n=1 Tax=Alteromonas salexigens TaxID=2982530 RepID=A0ABT2VME0_9ALTE|nr:hypothetical protein [Alteromonas salexigens]MCU7554012.1 hypothetical protein [Alteromonas salexigens]
MDTGIKKLDKLFSEHGVLTDSGTNGFQSVTALRNADPKMLTMKLPYCMYQRVMALKSGQILHYHHFYLKYRQARLASYLITPDGKIVEQVDYQRDSKSVQACKKIAGYLTEAYSSHRQLAA